MTTSERVKDAQRKPQQQAYFDRVGNDAGCRRLRCHHGARKEHARRLEEGVNVSGRLLVSTLPLVTDPVSLFLTWW